MKNNLFSYATSELSQDAFICYLASFALEEMEGEAALRECAKQFLHLLVPEIDPNHVVLQSVEKQVNHIDVLFTAKYDDTIYKIIIEDKTFTDEHDTQLTRYMNNEKLQGENVKIRGVYYKTGFQSNTAKIEAAQYRIITREMMLDFLKPHIPNISNQIVQEYYEYWTSFLADSEQFKVLPVAKWG